MNLSLRPSPGPRSSGSRPGFADGSGAEQVASSALASEKCSQVACILAAHTTPSGQVLFVLQEQEQSEWQPQGRDTKPMLFPEGQDQERDRQSCLTRQRPGQGVRVGDGPHLTAAGRRLGP